MNPLKDKKVKDADLTLKIGHSKTKNQEFMTMGVLFWYFEYLIWYNSYNIYLWATRKRKRTRIKRKTGRDKKMIKNDVKKVDTIQKIQMIPQTPSPKVLYQYPSIAKKIRIKRKTSRKIKIRRNQFHRKKPLLLRTTHTTLITYQSCRW